MVGEPWSRHGVGLVLACPLRKEGEECAGQDFNRDQAAGMPPTYEESGGWSEMSKVWLSSDLPQTCE